MVFVRSFELYICILVNNVDEGYRIKWRYETNFKYVLIGWVYWKFGNFFMRAQI